MIRTVISRLPKQAAATAAAAQIRSTTILGVRKNNETILIGDKQVTLGNSVAIKHTARKLRVISKKDHADVLVGIAGSVADALSLLQRLEGKIDEYPGQTLRACVELAKAWRSDKYLRRLEASLIVADPDGIYQLDGAGNVLEPDDEVIMAAGSGGMYATAAARALYDVEGMTAEQIALKAMQVATSLDVHSNNNYDILRTQAIQKITE
eukprot:NODE_2981_length_1075_cov_11.819688_g2735_i0.p2 GENE.NODE_2981_length_1075_cov_11.819688_g2735_i0~~NODE_2981_length_1075_cov_11.819688_g2735_i0.p2  ORF type:complete len:209 (+),score=56.65 NODE_2981_length_1075_cov_11.819688_g2735_i0:209-835(+)